jgi:predicted DNA-binding transcriptional regulator AlpA
MANRQLITVAQLAEKLQLGQRSIWRYRDEGRMPPPVRLGKNVRYRVNDIEAWIDAGCPDVRRTGWAPPPVTPTI